MTWLLSPSGWPTNVADGGLFEQQLLADGWQVIDQSQVQAAVDAYNAGTPETGPVLDLVSVGELQDPASAASIALRAAYGARPRQSPGASIDPNGLAADPAFAPLTLPTPDGSGSITHPSVYFNPLGWGGYRYWMAATPYNGSSPGIENPCIYASNDGDTWVVPAGVTNPIEAAPGLPQYNSDTHLTEGPDGRLYCIWRRADGPQPSERWFYRASADGVDWSDKQQIWSNDGTVTSPVSPAVVWTGARWEFYYVDSVPSPNVVKRVTSASLAGPMSAPQVITVPVASGRDPWHLDVKFVGGQYVMLLMDGDVDTSGNAGRLYLCTSRDGLTFTRAAVELVPQRGAWHSAMYRSCLVPTHTADGLGFEIFYAGISPLGAWRVGRTRTRAASPLSFAQSVALGLSAGASKIAPYLAADRFARADGALGTAESGQAWTTWGGSPVIVGGQAGGGVDNQNIAVINLGAADHYAEIAVPQMVDGYEAWLICRGQDSSNYLRCGYGPNLVLQKIVAGAATSLLSADVGAWTAGDRIGLLCSGSTLTVYRNGYALARVTDASLLTGTRVGYQTWGQVVWFDNLVARAAVAGQ